MPILTAQERLGTEIGGRYKILELLGEGGFSAVFRAEHLLTRRQVALKLLHAHLVQAEAIAKRFFLEAETMSRLRHPAIVEVLDAGKEQDGTIFLALELLEGETLEKTLQRTGHLTQAEAVQVTVEVLDALATAHEREIIHRDIKPANIFLSREGDGRMRAKLLDFGIAHVVGRDQQRLTGAGAILGTPEYMSPEQGRGIVAGPAADLWSVGIVLYEMVSGIVPWTSEHTAAVLLAVANDPLPNIRQFAALGWFGGNHRARAAENPAERFPSAAEMGKALQALLDTDLDEVSGSEWHASAGDPVELPLEGLEPRHSSDPRSTPTLGADEFELVGTQHVLPRRSRSNPPPPSPAANAGSGSSAAGLVDLPLPPPQELAVPRTRTIPPPSMAGGAGGPVRKDSSSGFAAPRRESSTSLPAVRPRTDSSGSLPVPRAVESPSPRPPADSSSGPRVGGGPMLKPAAKPLPASGGSKGLVGLTAAVAGVSLVVAGLVFVLKPNGSSVEPGADDGGGARGQGPEQGSEGHDAAVAARQRGRLVDRFKIPPPYGLTEDARASFAQHLSLGPPTVGTSAVRIAASCAGSTVYAFSLSDALPVGSFQADVACQRSDLAVVEDQDADGTQDVVVVPRAGDQLQVLSGKTGRVLRSSVPLSKVIALQGSDREALPWVIAYVESSGLQGPSELVALTLRTGQVLWRLAGVTPLTRMGQPTELGLSVGPDADGDQVADLVAGVSVSPNLAPEAMPARPRCVELLSGATGKKLWQEPFCQLRGGSQSVYLGPDLNADGKPDVVVGSDVTRGGDSHVVLVSGADGKLLRRVTSSVQSHTGFGWPVASGASLTGRVSAELVVGAVGTAGGALHLLASEDGAVLATRDLPRGTVFPYLRAELLPGVLRGGLAALVVVDSEEGLRLMTFEAQP